MNDSEKNTHGLFQSFPAIWTVGTFVNSSAVRYADAFILFQLAFYILHNDSSTTQA